MTSSAQIVVRRKLVALLLALAFGCASVGNVAHRAIVQHVACEHGQLVELSSPGDAATQPVTTTLSTASAHDHHHCTLDGCDARDIQRSSVASVAFDPAWSSPTSSASTHGHAPLIYAPKTSPPV